MQTSDVLPNVDVRNRFATLVLGYDRVDTIRAEHAALTSLAALLCRRTSQELTVADVITVVADLHDRIARIRAFLATGPLGPDVAQRVAVEILERTHSGDSAAAMDLVAWGLALAGLDTTPKR